ncbi:MAG: hypothetical protein KF850_07430 [Labilithrix sp.]|nr:hypothetical protein [Labilithrix sp.]
MKVRALVPLLVGALAGCAGRPNVPPASPPNPADAPPRVVAGPLEARPLLGDLPARASRFGAGPLAIVASGPMTEGERVGAFVEVPKDVCLLAYARSSASLEDIDLAAFAEEGNPIAVDEGPDPKPTLLICPPHPERVYVAAHAAAGEGLCVIAAQLVPRERADAVGRAVNAHGSTPKSPETWPGLDDHVRAHRAAIGGTWEEQRRVAVAVDSRAPSSVALSIDEGGCADVVVVPDEDVAVVDVDAFDADGRFVARARDTVAVRTLTVCSQAAVAGSLQVRPHVGRGLVAVVLAKAKGESAREMLTRPEVAWVASGQPLDAARAARERSLGKAGYAAATATHGGQLQLGRRVTVPVALAGAPCARVDVVAGAPLALVEAAIWDDAGALLASGDGADGTVLFACGKGKARLDLGTRGRPGPFSVLVRPEKWSDPKLSAHPLAASRMLARGAGPASGGHLGKAGVVRHAVLEPAKRYVHEANIPAGQCLAVALGVEGEGTGLEVRAFDAVSGDELDRAHGQDAAAVRACAGPATRSIRVEARATAGKLDAILGERLLGP